MKDVALPHGIRQTPPLKDGSKGFEARINRSGITMSKRFTTVKAAETWKNRIDALIESGIDPRGMEEKKTLLEKDTGAQSLQPKAATMHSIGQNSGALDVAPSPKLDMTVEQAINGYLLHRSTSLDPLPRNRITEFERVRDDLGNMKVANLVNSDLENYITLLRKSPIKRDDPRFARIRKAPSEKANSSAKARANARYKEKVRREREESAKKKPPTLIKEATARKYVMAFETAVKWQAKNNGLEYNRFLFDYDKGKKPAAWNGQRERRLYPGEEEKLYAAGVSRGNFTYTTLDWQMLIGFALETAMRQQELAKAKWDDQRDNWSKLFIPKTNSKTKKNRAVLLTPRARQIIEQQKSTCPKGETRIFHQFPNAKAMCNAFKNLRLRAGIEGLTFHDLRHEATSRLCERANKWDESGGLKISVMDIMEMTGHDTMATFRGYANLIKHDNARRLT